MYKNLINSAIVSLSLPSAILEAMETAALLICSRRTKSLLISPSEDA